MSDSYGFEWNGLYWARLTLEQPSTSRDDVFFGPVGSDAHDHSWLKWSGNDLTEIGARLKDRTLSPRPPAHLTTGLSTETLARFRAEYDPQNQLVRVEIADVFSGSAYTAAAAESTRTQSQSGVTMIPVDVPAETRVITGELAFCHIPSGVSRPSLSTELAYLPLRSDTTLGIAMILTGHSTCA